MKKRPSNKDILAFATLFILIFTISYFGLYYFGLVPKEIDESGRETVLDKIRQNAIESVSFDDSKDSQNIGDIPVRLKIPSIGIDMIVQNPQTKDPVLLDENLKNGIVRYPDSGLSGNGNMLLFGHSSNWQVVKNPNYKALNGIEKLKEGEEIFIKGEKGGTYVYIVRTVRMAPASEILVDFSKKENLLTISTCNTFGAKQDRYIVEAEFDRKEI